MIYSQEDCGRLKHLVYAELFQGDGAGELPGDGEPSRLTD